MIPVIVASSTQDFLSGLNPDPKSSLSRQTS